MDKRRNKAGHFHFLDVRRESRVHHEYLVSRIEKHHHQSHHRLHGARRHEHLFWRDIKPITLRPGARDFFAQGKEPGHGRIFIHVRIVLKRFTHCVPYPLFGSERWHAPTERHHVLVLHSPQRHLLDGGNFDFSYPFTERPDWFKHIQIPAFCVYNAVSLVVHMIPQNADRIKQNYGQNAAFRPHIEIKSSPAEARRTFAESPAIFTSYTHSHSHNP